tara:strand:- start:1747 stop:2151 length:405 start_codon:yes stop_codon:yes gene_type:complete
LIGSAIIETPNNVEEMKPSKCGCPFKAVATASIKVDLEATLSNFRDLTLLDDIGINFYSRHVAGASAHYQLRDDSSTLGVGVGWHNKCPNSYRWLDFTALRLVIPYRNEQRKMTAFASNTRKLTNERIKLAKRM